MRAAESGRQRSDRHERTHSSSSSSSGHINATRSARCHDTADSPHSLTDSPTHSLPPSPFVLAAALTTPQQRRPPLAALPPLPLALLVALCTRDHASVLRSCAALAALVARCGSISLIRSRVLCSLCFARPFHTGDARCCHCTPVLGRCLTSCDSERRGGDSRFSRRTV